MKDILIYVHGKGGSAEEANHYKPLFPGHTVIGFDYRSQTPWAAKEEFPVFFAQQRKRCNRLTLVANSIGAFFSMSALDEKLVDRAYLISPVVDMENLIVNMMQWANVNEQDLVEKKEIITDFGETLSWNYLCYVREHPISWNVPTCILCGEHWFHTEAQLRFLDNWIRAVQRACGDGLQCGAEHPTVLCETDEIIKPI